MDISCVSSQARSVPDVGRDGGDLGAYVYTLGMILQTTLRPAREADAEAIADIWCHGWVDGHMGIVPQELVRHRTPDDFRRRVPPRLGWTTVAVLEDRLVGFVMVHGDEVEQVYVDASARGRGVADALMEHAEREIGARHDVAWLAVAVDNTRARRFYERSGWRDVLGFDYPAEIEGGTLPVPCRRYEKAVKPTAERASQQGHARPELAISLAILGVLLAIGIPALQRGQMLLGSLLVLAAVAYAGWCVVAVIRARG
jgi:ribosomal protein S18 acetylase RimI-like enzyme